MEIYGITVSELSLIVRLVKHTTILIESSLINHSYIHLNYQCNIYIYIFINIINPWFFVFIGVSTVRLGLLQAALRLLQVSRLRSCPRCGKSVVWIQFWNGEVTKDHWILDSSCVFGGAVRHGGSWSSCDLWEQFKLILLPHSTHPSTLISSHFDDSLFHVCWADGVFDPTLWEVLPNVAGFLPLAAAVAGHISRGDLPCACNDAPGVQFHCTLSD